MRSLRSHLVTLVAALAAAAPATAQQTTTIQEWNVPWANTRPRDPYLDRQGRVWFVGQVGDYVGMLDPRSGEFYGRGHSGAAPAWWPRGCDSKVTPW